MVDRLRQNAHPVAEFLAPFFFVLLGAQVNLQAVNDLSFWSMTAMICTLAVLGKLIGCGLGALPLGWKDAARVGLGMVPRGEVGLIVASVGLGLHTISDRVYAVVVLMALVTTLIAPPLLRPLLPPMRPAAESE